MSGAENARVWRAGLYLRLSRDDDQGTESASITNQRAILMEYARRSGLEVVDEYVDDGWSGTNYDRPAFRRMTADVESGRIDCVAVKDLSRLGRNSARTADLLDEYFPAHGVRCISVVDGYDSLHLTGGMAMTTPLVAAMHEVYARDISCKIRSSFRSKMERGAFIGSFAPYGYRKDPADKNHLLPDQQAAVIVREIFQAAAAGTPPGEIASRLNSRGVAPPLAYRQTGAVYGGGEEGRWTSSSVCKLLRSPVYLGHTVQGKTGKLSFKSKSVRPRPPGEWITVEGTHQPLVDGETFHLARAHAAARRSPPTGGFRNVFSGVARCAQCGAAMTAASSRKKGGDLCCGRYKAHGPAACGSHLIGYGLLYEAALGELQKLLAALPEADRAALARELAEVRRDPDRELGRLTARQKEIAALQRRLYEDRTFARIPEGLYAELSAGYEAERVRLDRAVQDLRARSEDAPAAKRLEDLLELKELTRPLVRWFIDRIEVEQGDCTGGKQEHRQQVRIFYRFTAP